MKIESKFIGKNSLGYMKNNQYNLIVDTFFKNGSFVVQDIGSSGGQRCEYSSLNSFLKNWEIKNIEYIKDGIIGHSGRSMSPIKEEEYAIFSHPFKKYMRDKKLDNILNDI